MRGVSGTGGDSPGPTGPSAGCSIGTCLWTAASSGSPETALCWPGAPCSWLPGGTCVVRDALAFAYAAAPPGVPSFLTPTLPGGSFQSYLLNHNKRQTFAQFRALIERLLSTHHRQSTGLGYLMPSSERKDSSPIVADGETEAWPPDSAGLRSTVGQQWCPEVSGPVLCP